MGSIAKTKVESNRNVKPIVKRRSVRSGGKEKLQDFLKPMLASSDDKPFSNDEWIFEIKWDGYRAISEVSNNGVKLYSRNGLSFEGLYPKVMTALTKIKDAVVFDGEIVVMNEKNKPDFQKLQQYDMHPNLPIAYYIFDCLSYKGKSLLNLPLLERKKYIQKVISPNDPILKYSDHVSADGVDFFNRVVKLDMEGMIAKRADSLYHPGKRTSDWLKIKNHNTQEAIIAGFTAPRGSRLLFGALVLGIKEKGKLKYIGHTGTGFSNETLLKLHQTLTPLIQETSPFGSKIPVNGKVTWVKPELICEIKYTEITADGILRHPVFMGLRIDKTAKDPITIDKTVSVEGKKKIDLKSEKTENTSSIEIEGKHLTLTNLNKIYFPNDKITKGDILKYYSSVHQYLLPYLKDRPQSLRRNPNGIRDEGFFQKDAGSKRPEWLHTEKIRAESANRTIEYIICNDLATLLYMNNLGCIEINAWNSRIQKMDYPDYMVFDIDPSDENTFEEVIETSLVIKDILDKAGAPAFCKTSGASGLHIYVPLHAKYTYDEVRTFAELVMTLTEEQLPALTTIERSLDKRNGRIYLDYLQNKKGQTLASVYSVRPKRGATVSTPLNWKEVKNGLHPSDFTIHNIIKRIEKVGDLFSGVLTGKTDLQKCYKNLGAK